MGFPITCQKKFIFNPTLKYCDWPSLTRCINGGSTTTRTPRTTTTTPPPTTRQTTTYPGLTTKPTTATTRRVTRPPATRRTTPPLDLSTFCKDKNNGDYAHPGECKRYINCWSHSHHVFSCPGQLVFDPVNKWCVSNWSGVCTTGETRTTPGRPTITIPTRTTTIRTRPTPSQTTTTHTTTTPRDTSSPTTFTPPPTTISDRSTPLPPTWCLDKVIGIQPHPTDCQKFVWYDGRQLQIQSCPRKLVYNPNGQYCDWPSNVDCENRNRGIRTVPTTTTVSTTTSSTTTTTTTSTTPAPRTNPTTATEGRPCLGRDNDLVPYPGDCNRFIFCVFGVINVLYCEPHLAFNPQTKRCDWAQDVAGCEHLAGNNTKPPTQTPTRLPTTHITRNPPPTGPSSCPVYPTQDNQCQRQVCYYTTWSVNRPVPFTPDHVPACLCTHIIYAFAGLEVSLQRWCKNYLHQIHAHLEIQLSK